ncbi:MAG: RimK family alpha-L-glutamate ligase [Salinibacter sp.]
MKNSSRDESGLLNSVASVQEALRRGLPAQKFYLFLAHLYLLPWFVRRSFDCELPLRPFLDANPALDLGGLPIAPKLSRYGTEPPYLPSLRIGEDPDQSAVEGFLNEHPSPFVLKPLFGAHSRGVRKVTSLDQILKVLGREPMVLQPYVDAPKEYGINVMRVGERLRVCGLTEVPIRAVWGDGEQCLRALAETKYGTAVASQIENGDWTPPDGKHVPLQVAADPTTGPVCRDRTEAVTPALRRACERAADQIGLRFGRFDVKARSLSALQEGNFYVLEANGSPSLDLTLYDDRYSLAEKIERLRAHWDEFFHQARARTSTDENSWWLLATLLWFVIAPGRCVASFRHEVDNGELTSRA